MHISEFNFELPEELIAQHPLATRDQSRMLKVSRASGCFSDHLFAELPAFLQAGDLLVLNNTRVFPARLKGHRMLNHQHGATIEALLLRKLSDDPHEWEVLARPGRALRAGSEVEFGNGRLRGIISAVLKEGRRIVRFAPVENFEQIIDEIGNTPLPPYIRREALNDPVRLDEPQYQTVYARERGAIAAPTAGLHFTDRVFAELKAREIDVAEITHHVGYGTFQPVRVTEVEEHQIEAERYEISEAVAGKINQAWLEKRRVIAVGTTTTRCLESAAEAAGAIRAGSGVTSLYIYPGYRFKIINGLITNFHLPKSSLLMLVSAFAGRNLILEAYQHAVAMRYRFYSYGDCMLIL